jgi:DNA-binding NarL/FixJ family response regulator
LIVSSIRILICDDHPEFRQGLRALLETTADVDVVGEAADGDAALRAAATLQPDIILMDLNMPGVNGVEATRRVVGSSPHIGVVVLSMVQDDDSVFAAMQAGARGYLLKGARKRDIVRAVHAVAEGEAIFSPSIAQRLMRYFAASPRPTPALAFPELTNREAEILQLMAEHLTNPEIAARLGLTPKTIRNNTSNIFTKLQVADRAHAIIAARQAGLG